MVAAQRPCLSSCAADLTWLLLLMSLVPMPAELSRSFFLTITHDPNYANPIQTNPNCIAGFQSTVSFTLSAADLAWFDVVTDDWALAGGYSVHVQWPTSAMQCHSTLAASDARLASP